ncbi:hypothetical protein AB0L25_33835 [Spirillospora sp. NPDC052242]
MIADAVGGARQPFFAPIAAVVALNAVRGRRGVNALHLLTGVILGIGVGELTPGARPPGSSPVDAPYARCPAGPFPGRGSPRAGGAGGP